MYRSTKIEKKIVLKTQDSINSTPENGLTVRNISIFFYYTFFFNFCRTLLSDPSSYIQCFISHHHPRQLSLLPIVLLLLLLLDTVYIIYFNILSLGGVGGMGFLEFGFHYSSNYWNFRVILDGVVSKGSHIANHNNKHRDS
jgi:hypothetical protein